MNKQQEKDILKQKQTKKRLNNKKQQGEMIGPNAKKLQKLQYHQLILEGLPTSDLYQLSFMHRDVVNNVVSSSSMQYVVTVSIDGHIKFWKKVYSLVQFVKNFKAHNGLITGVSFSKNQNLLCSVGLDKTLKIFDLLSCDLLTTLKLPFIPICCEFISQKGKDWQLLAVGEEKTGKVWIIDPESTQHQNSNFDQDEQNENKTNQQGNKHQNNFVVDTLTFHKHPIKFIKMNWNLGFCISIDQRSMIEVWDPLTFDFPSHLNYSCKSQTDFLQLMQANAGPLSMNISCKGTFLSVFLKDKIIRVFNLKTGRLTHTINQSIKEITKIQEDIQHPNHIEFVLQQPEFQKRLNLQKDLQVAKQFHFNANAEFDQAQQFLIYASFHGIKFYSLTNKCIQRVIARKQTQRFIRVNVYQGRQMRNPNGNANSAGQRKSTDPLIIATAYRRQRFYMFSRRAPQIDVENSFIRDIINERLTKQQNQSILTVNKVTQKQNQVVLQTTMGDIHVLLYLQDCPKTCQNFIKLVKKGYYNGMIFHRVIKGFMNQSGCPKGDGTGGQSIWGGCFQDELKPQKYRFDRPYVLAMANKGPNTNGSQFFITVIACPWLDNKHTIFGRVIKGIQTVCDINKIKTDKGQKPLTNVKIMSAKVI